jgi:N-acetylglutamate synthase-like GNAT family acetyltransferase
LNLGGKLNLVNKLVFRYAERKDIPLILQFIKDLADYEKMLEEVIATEEFLEEWIFEKNKAEVLFAIEDKRTV